MIGRTQNSEVEYYLLFRKECLVTKSNSSAYQERHAKSTLTSHTFFSFPLLGSLPLRFRIAQLPDVDMRCALSTIVLLSILKTRTNTDCKIFAIIIE